SAAGPDGNLWFTEHGGGTGRMTTSGVETEGIDAYGPVGITAGPDGNIWFTDPFEPGGGAIRWEPTSGDSSEGWRPPTPSSYPSAITAGPDGNLWFTEQTAGKIGMITTA